MQENLNPSQVGLITELRCITYLLEQGFNVLVPQGNYTKYDLVIEREGKFYRIQCKHAHLNEDESFTVSTWYSIRSTSTKQRYTPNDCDYFMTEFNNQYYIFPIFGTVETKFWLSDGHKTGSKLAKDYLAEKILNQL